MNEKNNIEILLNELKEQGEKSLAIQKEHFDIYCDFIKETKELQKQSAKRQATHLKYIRVFIPIVIIVFILFLIMSLLDL